MTAFLLKQPCENHFPSTPVKGQLFKTKNVSDEYEYYHYDGSAWVKSAPLEKLDPALPMHTHDLIRLVDDPNRTPLFAGRIAKRRTYLRDFVAYCYNVIAICNVEHTLATSLTDFDTPSARIKEIEDSPNWQILSRSFKPIDAYNLNQDLMELRIQTKSDGLRRGLGLSGVHPNILVNVPEQARQQRIIFCADCEETYPTSYEVRPSVWKSVVQTSHCFLCLPCLEKRLERKLTIEDFTGGDINTGIRFGYSLAQVETNI